MACAFEDAKAFRVNKKEREGNVENDRGIYDYDW